MKIVNLILCGGSGTRLWPLSRTNMPKQFLPIFPNSESLFLKTINRNLNLCHETFIATSEQNYFVANDQLSNALKNLKNKKSGGGIILNFY